MWDAMHTNTVRTLSVPALPYVVVTSPSGRVRPMDSTVLNAVPRGMSILVLAAGMIAQAPNGRANTVAQIAAAVRQALAPGGKLRVGVYPGSPTSMIRDRASGETKGLAYELGQEFARRLNIPFEPVEFTQIADVLDALKRGAVDFTVTNASPARAKDVDFTARNPRRRAWLSRAAPFVDCHTRRRRSSGCSRRCHRGRLFERHVAARVQARDGGAVAVGHRRGRDAGRR